MKTQCRDCLHFEPSSNSNDSGICRVLPPTRDPGNIIGLWPEILIYDWCGEFEDRDEPEACDDPDATPPPEPFGRIKCVRCGHGVAYHGPSLLCLAANCPCERFRGPDLPPPPKGDPTVNLCVCDHTELGHRLLRDDESRPCGRGGCLQHGCLCYDFTPRSRPSPTPTADKRWRP